MTTPPQQPKIYHITHVDNLAEIIRHGNIYSDARRIAAGLDCNIIGMSTIKWRRLEEIEVTCHAGTKVGEYVPFYFCPRSIMLYILYMGNHPELTYRGGQRPIVHLQADFHATVEWANRHNVRWAFSDRNAGAYFADFFNNLDNLDKVNWEAVAATDFRDMQVKEGKQAEFLVYDAFPWTLVEKIGVVNAEIRARVQQILRNAGHRPPIAVEPSWYY
ncbi:MAG: DUF4433 domain-containing protein [Deltaproteobacteria bacterium]|nr:MAG: DUF4433 domain-containing protein [Deltaproteobacteria bacterium]